MADLAFHAKAPTFGHLATDDGHVAAAVVGSFLPDPWGLHDVLGNAGEWCSGAYEAYSVAPHVDPAPGPTSGRCVARGSSWYGDSRMVRVARRAVFDGEEATAADTGFRLAADVPTPK